MSLQGNNLRMSGFQLLNALAEVLATDPVSPAAGRFWFNSVSNHFKFSTGSGVIDVTDALNLGGHDSAYHLARANHTGTQASSTISDLATVVKAYSVSEFAAAAADVNLNSHKITNLATPTSPGDAVTKAYADALATGLTDFKDSARVATTANITLSGTQTIDGVSVIAGNRVLVKNQTTGGDNGIYVCAAGAWSRSTDADSSAEVNPGMFIAIEEGTTNGATQWVLATTGTITLGTTSLSFTKFAQISDIVAGAALTRTGNTLDVVAGTGITVSGDAVNIDTTLVARKYTTTFGDGSATSYVITHNLGTRSVTVQVFTTASTYDEVTFDVQRTSTNTVTIICGVAPSSGQYTVVVIG